MSEWRETTLGDHISIKHGYAFSGEGISDVDNGKVLVTPGNFEIGGGFKRSKLKFFCGELPPEYILKPQDLIVTMTDLSKEGDTLGYPALVPSNQNYLFLHNQRIGKVVFADNLLDKKYLYYVLCTKQYRHEVLASATGTSIKHTSPKRIESYNTMIPLLPEQKAIAGVLGALDDKIEVNRRMNATLEAMARALFKSWFIDFDPVKAKRDGRPPYGLDPATANLFPSRLTPSPLGDIPEGWEVGRLSDIVTFHNSKRIPLSSRERTKRSGSFRYFGATSVMDYINDYIFDGTYILVGEDGSVVKEDGSPFLQYVWGKFWVNNHAHILQGKNGWSVESLFLLLSLASVQHLVTGAVQPKLSMGNLGNLAIISPTDKLIMHAFNQQICFLFEKKRYAEDETKKLETLRDYLLPKLISGEIRIPDAEKLVEEV